MFIEKEKLDFDINTGGYVVIFPVERASEEMAKVLESMIYGAVGVISFNVGKENYCGVLVDFK